MVNVNENGITIHDEKAFIGMRKAGELAASVLDYITPFVEVGISTGRLDELCHKYIIEHGAIPAPLNYKGFPKSTCISINHVICHGIPDFERILKDGDILNIDITVILDGWYGDTSRMFYAGKPNIKAKKLCDVTYDCLMIGIEQVRPGNTIGDIGYAIQSYADRHRYSVVDMFCGHGLGRVFHCEPSVLHTGKKGKGVVLEEGMFFTIEPMINIGTRDASLLSDGWTAVTRDRKLSAQFEHSLAVTSDGFEIFTLSPKGLHKPPYK